MMVLLITSGFEVQAGGRNGGETSRGVAVGVMFCDALVERTASVEEEMSKMLD